MKWTLISDKQPPEFKNVLFTMEGFDEVVLGARWKDEYFLINDFEQRFNGDNGAVKVLAWRYLPAIYVA